MKASAWRGLPPRLISLSGRLASNDQALPGVEIEALDSTSGWASITDEEGNFVLPDVMWYPDVRYWLVVSPNDYQRRTFRINATTIYPEGGILNVGELQFQRGRQSDGDRLSGRNSITHVRFDASNSAYYRELFDSLTAGKRSDEEKMAAINEYVAGRLVPKESQSLSESARSSTQESPRQTLQDGSRYCGKLAMALATIAEAGNYKARVVNIVDEMVQPSAHMVTEIYYGDVWHLYDPTTPPASCQRVNLMSYRQMKLQANFVSIPPVTDHLPMIHQTDIDWLRRAYASGFHHYYCFEEY